MLGAVGNLRGETMSGFPVPQGRRSKRVITKRRASLVINLDRKPKRLPCLVLDSSKEGFRLRGSFNLIRRGQMVELILDEETSSPECCSVVWVGKAGSKQESEIGLQAVKAIIRRWPHFYRKLKPVVWLCDLPSTLRQGTWHACSGPLLMQKLKTDWGQRR